MKLRIENNAIRFRITPEELDRLRDRGRVEAATQLFSPDGGHIEGEFIYAIVVDGEGGAEGCLIEPGYIMLILPREALGDLCDPDGPGYRYQRESHTSDGGIQRFDAHVELDKPVKRPRPEA